MITPLSVADPHAAHPISIISLINSILKHRQLIVQLAKREVVGRYKGSFLGMTWSFFNPVFMLVVYTFVFSVAFKARWGAGDDEGQDNDEAASASEGAGGEGDHDSDGQ